MSTSHQVTKADSCRAFGRLSTVVLKKIIGGIGVFFGFTGLAVGMVGLAEILQGIADGGTYGAMVFCWGLGAFSLRGGIRALKAADEPASPALAPARDPESIVLAIAAQGAGRVTVPEVAAKSRLTIEEATETLLALSKRAMAEAIVTEEGVVVYQIRGLLSVEQKANAIDILDS